jgi:signal transduction histidine kinase/CheY-like chemotaxis protein
MGFDFAFPREYLRAALLVSLLSVWVLVGLFFYLNRYTKRRYFTTWTAAWLFYALWLTLSIAFADSRTGGSTLLLLQQWCVGISAIFLLWGSLQFSSVPTRQPLIGLFMVFLLVWSYASPLYLDNRLLIQMPVFGLIGLASIVAALSFYRLRRRQPYIGAGLLSFGFFLWGLYLASYPISQEYESLTSAGFLVSAVLQLFIAVSMIVLVLEEVRHTNELVVQKIESIQQEKETLHSKIITTEEQCRSLFDQARLHSDLQRAYDDLRQAQQSVVQQERLRALGQMASGVAHDINNALSPIVAFTEIICNSERNLQPQSKAFLEHIQTAAEDIARIVARMREFYRRRDGRETLQPVELNRLVQQVIDLTRPRWRDMAQREGIAIEVKTDLAAELPELHSDQTELREALINLVVNSVDAMPNGGTITMSTTSRGARPEPSLANQPSQVVLEVRDTGTGMDEKTRRRCLEPFFSTKVNRGGTGLGLAMVYGMMERHEGTVEVESQLGQGTTIRLIFPLQPAPKTQPTIEPALKQMPARLRILCIDDEPLLRLSLKEGLGQAHHEVSTAEGGKEGLAAFREAKRSGAAFNLVITDLGMPHVDGRQVTAAVKAESPETPVIMLTGWGGFPDDDGAHLPQPDWVLGKPPRLRELLRVISQATARTSPVAASPSPQVVVAAA